MLSFMNMCGCAAGNAPKEDVDEAEKALGSTDQSACDCAASSSLRTCICTESALASFEECECFEGGEEGDYEEELDVEFTLAILKPGALCFRLEIERRIRNEGFQILQTSRLKLTPEQASEFYKDAYPSTTFPFVIQYITSGPIEVMVLAKHNAIKDWKFLMGPEKVSQARSYSPDSLRARYGNIHDDLKNAFHGSKNRRKAEEEIHYFFPDFIIEPIQRGLDAELFLWDNVNSLLSEGLKEQCCKSRPSDPIIWLANWLIRNNPNKPKLPEDLTLVPS